MYHLYVWEQINSRYDTALSFHSVSTPATQISVTLCVCVCVCVCACVITFGGEADDINLAAHHSAGRGELFSEDDGLDPNVEPVGGEAESVTPGGREAAPRLKKKTGYVSAEKPKHYFFRMMDGERGGIVRGTLATRDSYILLQVMSGFKYIL